MVSSTRFRYVAQTAIRLRIRLRIPEKMTDGFGSSEEPKKMNGRLQVRWRTQRKWTASDPGLAPEEDERTASDPVTDPKKMNGSGSELTDPKIWRHRSEASVIFLHCEIGGRASGETFPPPQAQQFRNNSVSTAVFSYVQNRPRNERTDHTNNWNKRNQVVYFIFLKFNKHGWYHIKP